jgi:hypothetical protein
MFYSVSNTDKYNILADNAVMREREIMAYDINITNYTAMLEDLPQEDWPDFLAQYKTATLDHVPDEFDDIVSQYQYRDRLRYLIKTEKAERAKSFRVYEALIAQLPEAERDTLMAAAISRAAQREAQQAD